MVLETASDTTISITTLITAADVLSTWLVRGSSSPQNHILRTPFSSTDENRKIFQSLVDVVLRNFDTAQTAALTKSLKDLFNTILSTHVNLLGPGYADNLLEQVLHGLKNSAIRKSKVLYFVLDALVRAGPTRGGVPACQVIAQYSTNPKELIAESLQAVAEERGIAAGAGKAVISVLAALKKETVHKNDPTSFEQWFAIWATPLLSVLRQELDQGDPEAPIDFEAPTPSRLTNLNIYVLPGLLKLAEKHGFELLLEAFKPDITQDGLSFYQKNQGPYDPNINPSRFDTIGWLSCIKVGREIGLVGEIGISHIYYNLKLDS